MAVPSLSYTEFKYQIMDPDNPPASKTITLNRLPVAGETFPVSFKTGFNTVDIKFTPSIALAYYEVRISELDEEYGIGKGLRMYRNYNLESNVSHSFTLTFSNSQFSEDEKTDYVIGLYGKGADSDGYWDVAYLFFTSDGKIYAPSDYDGIETPMNVAIPSA